MHAADSRGLRLSTTQAAAAPYRAGVDALLRYEDGLGPAMREALAEDPGFALGHAARAIEAMVYGDPQTARSAAARASELGQAASERERGHIAVVAARVAGSPHALELAVGHLRRHPRDALVAYLALGALRFSGLPDVPARLARLVALVSPSYADDDWWWLGAEAFRAQEQGRYDDAAELCARAFAVEPRGGWAAHALTHVHYETATHGSGRDWLDAWLAEGTSGAAFATHLQWHAALHELAEGDVAAARRRFETSIRGRSLVDGASMAWRLVLLGARAALVQPPSGTALTSPASVFAALHCGLALAATGDVEALADLAARVRHDPRPAFPGVCAPVLEALGAFLEERYAAAVALLSRIEPEQLARLGGSAPQREVVTDTLIAAALRSGDARTASRLMQRRTDQAEGPDDGRPR